MKINAKNAFALHCFASATAAATACGYVLLANYWFVVGGGIKTGCAAATPGWSSKEENISQRRS